MSQLKPTDVEANKYAENYVLYGDQSRAWRLTFPNAKVKPETVHYKASLFHKIEKVVKRIAELSESLKKQSEEEFNLTTSYLKKALSKVIEAGLKDKVDAQENTVANNLGAVVSAIGEVNRMDGNHFQYGKDDANNEDAKPLTINFTVSEPVKEVIVTNAKT